MVNGSAQGFSFQDDDGRHLAINPTAVYPPRQCSANSPPGARALHKRRRNPLRRRGIEAEATAYLVAKELELIDWDAAESRAYIQRWLGGTETTEGNISRVFAGVTRILCDETAVGPANDETAVIAVSDAVTQLRESQDRWRGLQKNRKRSGCAHPASRIH
jgi:hypothetical protein